MSKSIDLAIEDLRKHVLEAGTLVKNAVHHACAATVERSEFEIKKVFKFEEKINEHHLSLDDHCMKTLAKLSPYGQDLRTIISVIKINSDLERMGDRSRNIVRILQESSEKSKSLDFPAFNEMMGMVKSMVELAVECFPKGNVQQAMKVLNQEQDVDDAKRKITSDLLKHMEKDPQGIKSSVDFILIVRNLERIADHCTNIAEETIFVTTGKDIRHGQQDFMSSSPSSSVVSDLSSV